MEFHKKCGSNVTLSNGNTTASRTIDEFNDGLVFSAAPLENYQMFQVSLDKKISDWIGGIEIGVISFDPENSELPPTAIKLRNDAWIMSGNSILKNGSSLVETYGRDLETLKEGDVIGVMKTALRELVFYINGECLGVAAQDLPDVVYAVIDLYGMCVQISIKSEEFKVGSEEPDNDYSASLYSIPDGRCDKLRFHHRCGTLVVLSADKKTAERCRPMDEFNNGVAMTHRPLYDNELFQVQIDQLVDKWSGSIEVGVTTHNPSVIEFPATMTNMRSGTIMMSGCGILTNGKGTRREYGQYNLDELREGDRVGMMRKSNGDLHYFINGMDQGVAASKLAQHIWGVIDLYGMTIKITIIDQEEDDMFNIRRNNLLCSTSSQINSEDHAIGICSQIDSLNNASDRLLFHPVCGAHAVVINAGLTAHRPHATDDFNNGVVLTNRPLKPGELFEVRLERVVSKWAGSIEIGVTTHSPDELEFPFTMTNMRTGTWMMTGNGVMHNRITVLERYGSNLDRLMVGDRVGVVRDACGTLRFFVNGIDQGPATTGVPENVFGVIDLYGQAAQASIVQNVSTPDSLHSSISNTTLHGGNLAFNRIHGRNIRLRRRGTLAIRDDKEFDHGLIFSSRPLRECEMFQIKIEKLLDRYRSTLKFGVVAFNPSEVQLMDRIEAFKGEKYILTDFFIRPRPSRYPIDLDKISVGTRLGVMRHGDRSVHFYLDGMDQGKAWDVHAMNIYAFVDLYGKCSRVSLCPPQELGFIGNSDNSLMVMTTGLQSSHSSKHCFSEYCGKNIKISNDNTVARVASFMKTSNLVFSAALLRPDEIFEVEILKYDKKFVGSLKVGVTDVNILNAYVNRTLPNTIEELSPQTLFIEGRVQTCVGTQNMTYTCPTLDGLDVNDTIGLRRIGQSDCIALYINMEEVGVVFSNVPDKVYAVFDLCGPQVRLGVVSIERINGDDDIMEASDDANSLHLLDPIDPLQPDIMTESLNQMVKSPSTSDTPFLNNLPPVVDSQNNACTKRIQSVFLNHHGKNIHLDKQAINAKRVIGFDDAITISKNALKRGQCFKFRTVKVDSYWSSTLMLGFCKTNMISTLPRSASNFAHDFWIVSTDRIYYDGLEITSDYGKLLESVTSGSVITMMFSENGELRVMIDCIDLGSFAKMLPDVKSLYPIVDLYGKCEHVTIINNEDICDLATELSAAEELSLSENRFDTQTTVVVNHQYEKADLEYHEKETANGFNLDVNTNLLHTGDLSKSVSENESRNIIIQNLSLTVSSSAANEVKNMEIKQRTANEQKQHGEPSTQKAINPTDRNSPFQHSFPFDSNTNNHVIKKSVSSQSLSTFSDDMTEDNVFALLPASTSVQNPISNIRLDHVLHDYIEDAYDLAKKLIKSFFKIRETYTFDNKKCIDLADILKDIHELEYLMYEYSRLECWKSTDDGSYYINKLRLSFVGTQCYYVVAAAALRSKLGFDDSLFDDEWIDCYCERCNEVNESSEYCEWVYFPFRNLNGDDNTIQWGSMFCQASSQSILSALERSYFTHNTLEVHPDDFDEVHHTIDECITHYPYEHESGTTFWYNMTLEVTMMERCPEIGKPEDVLDGDGSEDYWHSPFAMYNATGLCFYLRPQISRSDDLWYWYTYFLS